MPGQLADFDYQCFDISPIVNDRHDSVAARSPATRAAVSACGFHTLTSRSSPSAHYDSHMQYLRLCVTCGILTCLGAISAADADVVSRIDLRRAAPEPIDYFVVICARESEPWGTGHTFVVWLQQDNRNGKVSSQGFGFYPEVEKVVVRLFTGDGAVRDESTKSASVKPWLLTHRLIVQVDRDKFEAGIAKKNEWAGSGIDYHLLNRNCTHFAHEIMKAIELGAPEPEYGERPATYVARLMKLGLGRPRPFPDRLPATFVNERR